MLTLLDINNIRQDFPLLHQKINAYDLVYFDNAATTQKPKRVIKALQDYYEHDNANVHRAVYTLSVRATEAYELARAKVRHFINASNVRECIFVRGTTEAINLVSQSYLRPIISPGDEILITYMEHHSNIVPWQILCEQTGAVLKVCSLSAAGEINLDDFTEKLSEKTRFVSVNYASNAIGTINPIKKIIELAHANGSKILIDGAQAIAHLPVDVQDLDCDFFAFSAHKMYGPTGIGVLWGKEELLMGMNPYQGGGEMIESVSFSRTEYAPIPQKFEAGTPNIAGAIGLGAAIDYLESLDLEAIAEYELYLLAYATNALCNLPGFKIIGTAPNKVPIISFIHDKIHSHDIATIVDAEGIAIRSGNHCAMPLMNFYDLAATSRMSFSFYNTTDEIDRCIKVLGKITEVFA